MIVHAEKKRPPVLQLFVDGGSRGNPGPAGSGVVIADADGTPLVEHGYYIGRATNNVAEYKGLLHGLELAAQFDPERLEIFADSELMVRQITGQYRVKSPDLAPLFQQAQLALLKFDSWQIRHIPRAKNDRADHMANLAMDKKANVEEASDDVAALPAETSPSGQQHEPSDAAVEAEVTLGCDPRVCQATTMAGETFRFEHEMPEGLCLFAAAAILPKVLDLLAKYALSGTAPAAPVKVTCPRPNCHARFALRLVTPDEK
ncbi:MAG: ribonuclease HI family protein [Phycisphaerae bacterium]|nr:ribonuclease HI family protein [Phycisphaerae bacterium]